MKKKLWVLKLVDCCIESKIVVRAKNERSARKKAAKRRARATKNIWMMPAYSTCEVLEGKAKLKYFSQDYQRKEEL